MTTRHTHARTARRPLMVAAWTFLATSLLPALAEAAAKAAAKVPAGADGGIPGMNPDSIASKPLVLMVALGALSLVPFLILMVTSFVKISVVLSIVRSALGTQQIPPTQVITGLAIILTIYIMMPVGLEMYRATGTLVDQPGELMSTQSVGMLIKAGDKAKEPMREFLLKHSTLKDRNMFFNLAKRLRQEADRAELSDRDFIICIPSFVISELKQAFQIGFILFVPFIVIDMVVANILLALGMHMLSPTTISMPFKLLLFVLVDGWYLITKGLVISYL
ncbi:MAG TPA: type III secretion system export apparatus subunit SctR [Myxococcales bacterium]|jgi:type III secretion protein R